VQLTPDQLVVNYLRGETDPYPGFATLLAEAMAHCRRYGECYQPIGILEAALHYVDQVAIPLDRVAEGRVLRSEDYFTLDLRFPEEVFGTFATFEITATVQPPDGTAPVQIIFATVPPRVEDSHRKFRLEWHTPVRTGDRMTEDEVRAH